MSVIYGQFNEVVKAIEESIKFCSSDSTVLIRNSEEEFEGIFDETGEMCSVLDIEIPHVRKRKVSILLEHNITVTLLLLSAQTQRKRN